MTVKVTCLSNMPYLTVDGVLGDKPMISLTVGATYEAQAEGDWLRVRDNSGEHYLYPQEMFRIES